MKRAAPYALFAAVTLAVFWKFLLFGHTIHAVVLLETQLGLPPQEPPGWFRSERPRARVADNIVLLAQHLRLYNEGLKKGELRLWNPSIACGVPLYADPMVHPFYPPQLLLHALLPPEPAYELFLMLHLFGSGAALYALLRTLGRSAPASSAAGLVWMLLGYNSMWFSTGILAGVSVWGPLALLALHRAFETQDLSHAARAGIAMGLAILGSHPQHALHVLLFSLGWLGVVGWKKEYGWRLPLRMSALYVLLSTGIGLAAILTRLDSIANGYRNPGADFRLFYAEGWPLAAHLLDAIVGKAVSFENPLFQYEFSFHAGLAAVTLAVMGAVRGFRDPRICFLAIVAVATLAVAFLKPLAFLMQSLPLLSLSPPSRWLFIFGLAIAMLAAFGWDALHERVGRVPLALAGITALTLLILLLHLGPFHAGHRAAIDTLLGFAFAAGAAFALRRSQKLAAGLALGAVLFELLPAFLQAHWHVDPGVMKRTPDAIALARSLDPEPWRGTGSLGSPYSTAYLREHPEDASGLASVLIQEFTDGNNLLALFGVENAAGFEAILPESYMNYVSAAGGERAEGGRSTAFLAFRSRLADAMNLKFLFLPPGFRTPPRFRLLKDFGGIRLYENPAALPRAWLAGRVQSARDEKEALDLLRDPSFDPRTSVILEGAAPSARPGPVEGRVAFTRREPDRLDLDVTSKAEAILVVAENDYPGWEAEVDGRPAPIFRANVAFRAVAIPSGTHAVTFRFRPESARHGAIGSALFLLAGLGFVGIRRFRTSASAPAEPPR